MNTKIFTMIAVMAFLISCKAEFSSVSVDSTEPAFTEEGETSDAVPEPKEVVVDEGEDLLVSVEYEVGKSIQPVDVFIVMDTSSSMNAERRYLESSIPKFINDIAGAKVPLKLNLVYDFNKANIAVDPSLQGKVQAFNMAVDSTNAVSVLNDFFNEFQSTFKDSRMDIVIVSDDDALGAGNLADDFKFPQTNSRVHAIVGQRPGLDSNNEDCKIRNVGMEYMKLADKNKGAKLDLCKKGWDQLVESIVSVIKEDPNRVLSLEDIIDGFEPLAVEYKKTTYLFSDENSPFKIEGKNLVIDDDIEIVIADKIKFLYKIPSRSTMN